MVLIGGCDTEGQQEVDAMFEQVIDPVCGMTVATDKATGPEAYKGRDYWFCSEDCRDRFQRDPARFVNREPAARTKELY
ncbi:MAG: YHS domain-containing protein [bacterium]